MSIFKNNIDKLPKSIYVNSIPYELVIMGREGYKVMYLQFITNRICKLVDKNGQEDLLIVVDYNFNKAINLMLKKLKEFEII